MSKLLRHEDGVSDGYAETDPLDATQLRFIAGKRRKDSIDTHLGSDMIQYIDVLQSRRIILAVAPELLTIYSNRVGHTEIVKGAEKFFLQRLGQSNLSGKSIAKICMTVIGTGVLSKT